MTDPETHSDPDPTDPVTAKGAALRVPRSRGVVSGVLLVLAGAWGALAPFVGPYFDFAYTPKPGQSWHWTAARGWFEVLPGGLAVFGGLLLILSANRIVTTFGAVLAAVAGGWFVVGQQVSFLLTLGSPGAPAARGDRRYVAEYLAFFTGLGAVIIFFAAIALGRLSVRSVRDARAAARRDQDAALAEQRAAEQQAAEQRAEFERADTDRAVTDRNAETWAAGQQTGGYGTPGSETPRDGTDHPSSAVTTELPVAAGATAVGAAGTAERFEDEHTAYRPAGRGTAGPDDDTAAMPIAPEPAEPVPAEPQPEAVHEPEPVPEPEPVQPEAGPPLVLEPPEGHPDAERLRLTAPAGTESERAPEQAPEAPGATWNPEAQSPTTTGELPALGSSTPPPAAAPPYRRGIQQPRRYFGPGNPAQADDEPAAETVEPNRNAVRTDEADDLDNLDLDERPR